ncbi:MAG: ABC transporter permease [Chloroflexi bacterium]|nr:ABC transporter permease [Chloroflexota bacterium]
MSSISTPIQPSSQTKHTISSPTASRWRRWIDWRIALAPVFSLVIYLLWYETAESGRYAAFILPHPHTVWERFTILWENGLAIQHTLVTLREALSGLVIATGVAIVLGYVIARIRMLSYMLMPYLIFIQAIPVVAIAPLLIIWVGPDIESKIAIAALITWFPLMVAVIVGIRSVAPNLRELMQANAATPWQIFWHLEVPAAMPSLLGGFKIAVTLSVIGAAVGEFVSSREGLGYLVIFGRSTSDTPLVFVAIFLLTLMSLTLYTIVGMLEQFLLRWQRAGQLR